ncbi:MAG TPA: hypothetical protein VD737_08520, partial [Steroidobacteraceae bacterium]|nr:hypothetical protein [Steroidobacteraceae bacterium]
PRVLTGVSVGTGTIPAGNPEGEEEEAPQALPPGFEALEGIRRLIETGAGAFNLDDIGSAAIDTFDELRDALDALDGDDGNVTFQTVGDTTTFTVEIVKEITGTADFTVEAEEFGGEIDLGGVIDISADVVLTLEFGFDPGGFFVNTGASGEELKLHNIVLEGDARAAGRFGFLDIEAEVEAFTVDDGIELVVDLQDPMGDGKLRVSDFGSSLGDKVEVTLNNPGVDDVTLAVTASAAAILPGLESIDLGGAQLTLTWQDITDPGTLDITAGGGLAQDLIDFLSVDVQEVLDQVSQLDELADALDGFDVPLLQDTLSALADAADFISEEIIQPLTSLSGGQASFNSIQNLIMRLARSTGVDPAALGLAYDDGELTWHLDFGTGFVASDSLDLGFNSDSTGLADLSFSTDGSIEGTVGFELTVGIDIGAIVGGAPADEWFFLRDASASATLDIEATAINAEARFGFLSIGIEGGTAEAEAGFLITLNDPDNTDGKNRITLSELLDGLSSPGDLVSFDLTGLNAEGDADPATDANLSLTLPLVIPFLDVDLDDDQQLILLWSNLEDPDTISLALPEGLLENILPDFTNMDAGTLVSLLGTISNWLEDFRRNFDVANIPFVGTALDEALQFADLFSDTLLFDDHDDEDDATFTEKLLDVDGRPTFDTVQQMVGRLVTILGLPEDQVFYDDADETIYINLEIGDVDSASNFGFVDLPIKFDLLQDLAPIAELSSDSTIRLSAGGGITLTFGIYLGNAGAVTLTNDTLLADLKGGIAFSQARVVATPNEVTTVHGRLSGNAKFKLSVNGGDEEEIVIDNDDTEDNTSVQHLVDDINDALELAGLDTQVVAEQASDDGNPINRINLRALGGVSTLTLSAQQGDPAITQIGFKASMTAAPDPDDGNQLKIKGQADVSGVVGRLSGNAVMQVSLDTVNGGTPVIVTVDADDTSTNRNILDVVVDVQNAFDDAGFEDEIEVTSLGKHLIFRTLNPAATSLTINVAGGNPAQQLGLATSNLGNSHDLLITTSNGVVHPITFGPEVDTLGEVLSAISSQTGGAVSASFSDNDTRILLTDNLEQTTAVFKVNNAVGSTAAFDLAIFGFDTVEPEPEDDPRDFQIEGGLLGGVDPLDRLFVQNAQAQASVGIVTPQLNEDGEIEDTDLDGSTTDGLDAEARFGFVGIHGHGGISNLAGDGPLTASIDVALKPADAEAFDPEAKITLKDLIDNIGNIGDFLDGPTIDGSGKVELAVTITPSFSDIETGAEPTLIIELTSLAEILDGDEDGDAGYTIDTENFEDLLNFDEIGFDDILAALRALVDFLGQFEQFGFLNDDIPLINISINDMLSFVEDFEEALDEVQDNPAGTVQVLETKLKEAFGIPQSSDVLQLDLVDGSILRIDLNFEPSFSESLPVSLELPIETGPIDLSGNANLRAEGALDLTLAFGIDLGFLTGEDDFDIENVLWVFEDTGIAGSLTAGADDISFTAALGGLGARIVDGEAEITGAFNLGLAASAMTAGTGQNRRISFTDLIGDIPGSIDASLTGEVTALLPVYFPTESSFRGNIEVGGALELTPENGLELNGTLVGEDVVLDGFVRIPDEIFSLDFSQFSALDNLLLIIDGVDGFLGLLQDLFSGQVGGFTLPLVGDQLAEAADVIEDFRKDFIDGLRDAVETAADPDQNYISEQLFALLGPSGLNILLDGDDAGSDVNVGDIVLDTNVDEGGEGEEPPPPEEIFMQWNMRLGSTLLNAGEGLDFDIGIPGLGLETRGRIEVEIDWELALGFGVGISRGGFYIDTSDLNEFEVEAEVTLPDAGLTGRLLFLQLDADNNGNTGLGATFGVDIFREGGGDPLIGIADLGSLGIDIGVAAHANIDLGLELKLNSELVPNSISKVFPKIVGDFVLDFEIGDFTDPENPVLVGFDEIGNAFEEGLKRVAFENVGLDLGSFISDFLGPVVDEVQKFTGPIQPIIDVVTAPIPVVSDLAGQPITLVDLAGMTGFVNPDLIYAIADVITLVNSIPDIDPEAPALILPFGNFTIYDTSSPDPSLQLSLWDPDFDQTDRNQITRPSFDPDYIAGQLDNLSNTAPPQNQQAASFTNGLAGQDFGDFISFPIFQDPSQIFGLLMGNDISIIEID